MLDYLSESSRHEANILPKWVWIFPPYPPYTATWYNTPVSCSQITMSPQNVLSVRSVSSVSVVILIWRLCQNIISMASNNLQNKFIQNYGIEILKRREKYRWETIHSFPLQQFVMRCGFLLVEGCMVTCLLFNSEDYSCVICWLFNPYLILFNW